MVHAYTCITGQDEGSLWSLCQLIGQAQGSCCPHDLSHTVAPKCHISDTQGRGKHCCLQPIHKS